MQTCEEFTPDVKIINKNMPRSDSSPRLAANGLQHNAQCFVNFTERNVKKKERKKEKEKTGQILHFRKNKSKLIKIAINV